MKNAQVCCDCRRWIHSCVATLPFRATQARNTSRAKRNPECTIWSLNTSVFTLSLVWDWRFDPRLLLGVFPPWHVRWGNFKPQQISQTGIFTSPLYNPKTSPHCLKTTVCMCVTGLNLLQTANQYSLLLSISTQQWRAGSRPISAGLEQWLDMLLYDLSGESRKDGWIFYWMATKKHLRSHSWRAKRNANAE